MGGRELRLGCPPLERTRSRGRTSHASGVAGAVPLAGLVALRRSRGHSGAGAGGGLAPAAGSSKLGAGGDGDGGVHLPGQVLPEGVSGGRRGD